MSTVIAVDWGTTNRRIYLIDADGALLASERDDRGVTAIERDRFAEEAVAIRARFGDLPILCAGMVGSVRGWAEAPYLPCPAGIDALAGALHWVEPGRTAIVPGLSVVEPGHSDVMRGEEVQLLGAVAAGMAPADALLCQPGTHCKWARMEDGAIARFGTAMTGELFSLLRRHSLLADFMHGSVDDGAAFRDGVAASAEGTLLGALFGERASVLLGQRDRDAIAAHVSGLLIGTDVREQRLEAGEPVYILSDEALAALYSVAVEAVGGVPIRLDSHTAFLAGITRIWRLHNDRKG